jgi:5'-nucleotidase (lipoprotein e(P4) family)
MARMKRPSPPRPFVALLVALLAACASTAPPASPPATTNIPPAAAATPATTAGAAADQLADDVRWVRDAAEYRALAAQAFALAGRRVDELAAGRQPGTWAVALDVDETVLSNVEHEVELEHLGSEFDEGLWQEWVRRRSATALPGAVAFLERVRRLGGRIALVTNRDEFMRADTEANLRQQGVPFDVVLLRPSPDKGAKGPRFEAVERGTAAPGLPPLTVVLWVGDNIRDFPGLDQSLRQGPPDALAAFGDRFVILPNPMYGSWKPPARPPATTPAPTPSPPAGTNDAASNEGDGKVYVDEVRARLEKSLPAKLRVQILGSLADGCTHLGEPQTTRNERTFHVALPATRDSDKICTQALVPFDITVPVSITGLSRGTYTVEAGGKTDTFALQQDN